MLNEIAFWFFFVPTGCLDALQGMAGVALAQGFDVESVTMTPTDFALVFPILLVLIYCFFWGQACVLTVAKRLVASPAGRNRTSFKAVRIQARKFIGALFLTEILRTIITLLLMLLLIVPGVLYSIRTMFYDIMMIEEGKVVYGRPILRKSTAFVKGRTWSVLWRVFAIGICIFVPVGILGGTVTSVLTAIDPRLDTLGLILKDLVDAFAGMFFLVSVVALYADMKSNNVT